MIKEIKNYNHLTGIATDKDGDLSHLSVDYKGKDYIVDLNSPSYENERGLQIHEGVYQFIMYDLESGVAKVKPIKDQNLLEKIAVELHMEKFE